VRVLRDNLIDEAILIEKKIDLFSNYKKYDKNFIDNFRKKSKEKKRGFSEQLRSYISNLGKTLDQNLS
jgi:hypothetical protein